MWHSWTDGCAWETTFLVAILQTLSAADRTKKSKQFHPSAAENDTISGSVLELGQLCTIRGG